MLNIGRNDVNLPHFLKIARSSKGRTAGFGPVNVGSNPARAT